MIGRGTLFVYIGVSMREAITIEYCEKNRTKRATRGYKAVCPGCAGNDLWVTPENRSCYCWECGTAYRITSGDQDTWMPAHSYAVKEFDTKAIRQVYNEAASYYHSCLSKEHEQFLKQRGITQEAINFFKIGFCPSGVMPMYLTETAKEAGIADGKGRPWLADRIVFPYIADGEITDLRGRTTTNEDPKYKSLYHKSAQRGALYPFNYDAALKKAQNSKTIIITEGEIKAVVADQYNFSIVALPGMLSYRPGLVSQPGIRIVVVFDNSAYPDDRVRVDRAIARLSQHIPYFSVVTLPLLGEEKMDIDSYLVRDDRNVARFQHFVDNAIDYPLYRRLRGF
jgi:hypothetical protein